MTENKNNKVENKTSKTDNVLANHHPEIFKYTYTNYYNDISSLKGTVLIYNMNYGIKNKDSVVKYIMSNISINEPVDIKVKHPIYEEVDGDLNWIYKEKKNTKDKKYYIALYYDKNTYLVADEVLDEKPTFKPTIYVDDSIFKKY